MSIASRIEAIEQHLTDDYSVLTLAGADLTNVDKNILNLKPTWKERLLYFMNNGTQQVWDNWDKVNGTGETLTLNNTEEAPMSLVYKGNTKQNETPTPDSPVPIQVVSGDNSIVVCGKNFLDSSTFLAGSYQGIDTTTRLHTGQTLFLKSDTYTISTNLDMSTYKFYMVTGSTPTPFQNAKYNSGWVTNQQYSFTLGDSNKGYFCLCIGKVNGETLTVDDIKDYRFQLEKGNQATTYEPYTGESYPISLGDIELLKIGTYQDKIDKSTGKNLFDLKSFLTNHSVSYTENNDGSLSFTLDGSLYSTPLQFSDTDMTVSISALIKNVTSVNCYIELLNSDNVRVARLSDSVTSINNVSASKIRFNWGTGGNVTINNVMLNEGTTALEYEPYGTGWYVKKEIGKVVLNGSENWTYVNSSFRHSMTNLNTTGNDVIKQVANYFQAITYSSSWSSYDYFVCYTLDGNVVLKNKDITSINDFKTWLSTHNTIVYYVLATPTYTLIEESTLIEELESMKKSYENQTNISQVNNDMPFILDITALSKE